MVFVSLFGRHGGASCGVVVVHRCCKAAGGAGGREVWVIAWLGINKKKVKRPYRAKNALHSLKVFSERDVVAVGGETAGER